MKIKTSMVIGSYNRTVDIEYNSESESDCVQADKFFSRAFGEDEPREDMTDEKEQEVE